MKQRDICAVHNPDHKPYGTQWDTQSGYREIKSWGDPVGVENQIDSTGIAPVVVAVWSNGHRVPVWRLRYVGLHDVADWALHRDWKG